MSDLREAAEMALEALEIGLGQRPGDYEQAIKVATSATIALHKALDQPKRKWVGLTPKEVKQLWSEAVSHSVASTGVPYIEEIAVLIEAKLKEKNT